MSEPLDSTKAELHSFLDQDGDPSTSEPSSPETESFEEVLEGLDPTTEDALDEGDFDQEGEYEVDYEDEDTYSTLTDVPRHQRRRMAVNPPKLPLVIGMLLVVVSIGLASFEVTSKVPSSALLLLGQLGINPAILLVSGILLTTLALAQRGVMQSSTHKLLLAFEKEQAKVHNELQTLLEEKLSSQQDFSATNEAEAFEKLAMMFRKIESMLANLTKATRLLNKPIVDMHSQLADIGGPMTKLGTQVGQINEDVRLLTKSQNEAAVNFEKKWESQMQRQLQETQELLDKSEQVKRELLSKLDDRLDNIDTHVELLGESQGFPEKLDEIGKKLERVVQQGDEEQSERAFSEIQDSMGRILAAVEEISARPVPVAAATSGGDSSAGGGLATSRPATSPSGGKTGKSESPTGGNQGGNQGGKQGGKPGGKQGGKKVLSAIEKLKQLRGS